MWFTKVFIARPTLVFVTLAVLLYVGVNAWLTLPRQQFPNVDFPVVSVTAVSNGASPSELRDTVARPLEGAIAGAPSLDHLTTTIQSGQVVISATFSLKSDKNADLVEIQKRVTAAQSQLPDEVRAPVVASFNPSQSTVVELAVSSSTLMPAALSTIVTEHIVQAIEQLPGVSAVQTRGLATPALVVAAEPASLSANGVTITDLAAAVSANNRRLPGGYVTAAGTERAIDVRGDVRNADSVRSLPVGTATAPRAEDVSAWSVSERRLRVADLAAVRDDTEPIRTFSYVRGRRAVLLEVLKTTGASEVSVSDAVVRALPDLRAAFPAVDFAVTNVQSTWTSQQIGSVTSTLLQGVLLTAFVMVLFLGSWRNAVVVLIAIPTSLCVALGVMRLLGFTLDTVSLMAMTLVIGILVDDSIVVLENITRHRAKGESRHDAAAAGRAEIGLAAIVVTLVDVVIFVPIAMLPGEVGRILFEFGISVAVSTLASLLVSFTITPSLAGNWSLLSHWRPPAFVIAFDTVFERVRGAYVDGVLPWSLRHRRLVVGLCALVFAASVGALGLGAVGAEFMPATDRGQISIQLTLPPGTAIDETGAAMRRIEQYVENLGPDIASETATAGTSTAQNGPVTEATQGQLTVYLANRRTHSTDDYVTRFRRQIPPLVPGARVDVIPATDIAGGVAQPINYTVSLRSGGDPALATNAVARALTETPGAFSVIDGGANVVPQIEVIFDRAAARALDVSIGTASSAIHAALAGTVAAQYVTDDGIRDIFVVYPPERRTSLATVSSVAVRTGTAKIVHVGDFAVLRESPAPLLLTRLNRRTGFSVSANVAPGFSQSAVEAAFLRRVAALHLSPDVLVEPSAGGASANLAETLRGTEIAFATALLLVYLLMVALFDSYRSPAIIFFSLPMASVGAVGALALTRETLNLFSLIGAVMLVGLVMKNGILLVDYANRQRTSGMPPRDAIARAARVRFRPIVMTTVAMIAGMLPLALGLDPGAETRRSLGTIVIGGLTTSLFLTLVLVPIAYLWLSPREERMAAKPSRYLRTQTEKANVLS